MIETVTRSRFMDWFRSSDTYKENFSYEGLSALFDWYSDLEDGTGQQEEFDPVSIACEWSEYESLDEVKENFNDIETLEDLQDKTSVIELDSGRLLVYNF